MRLQAWATLEKASRVLVVQIVFIDVFVMVPDEAAAPTRGFARFAGPSRSERFGSYTRLGRSTEIFPLPSFVSCSSRILRTMEYTLLCCLAASSSIEATSSMSSPEEISAHGRA